MKRLLCLMLICLLLPACHGEKEYDFLTMTGLSELVQKLDAGQHVVCISYDDMALEDSRSFTTYDEKEIDRILKAALKIEVVSPYEYFMTDLYPCAVFTLSDGSSHVLSFDWDKLSVDGVNYTLVNADDFWDAVAETNEAHNERKAAQMSVVNIRGSMGDIYGELTIPAGAGKLPLVILSHGFGGNHTGQSDYAAYFNQRGFATYNFDFCGGGYASQSAGSVTEMSVLTEAEDLLAIIDYFKGSELFSGIYLWGASQGGFVSTYAAAMRPETVKALVIEFPAYVLQDDAKKVQLPDGSFPETYRALGTLIGHVYGEDAVSFDIYDVMKNYPGNVLILHGDQDGIVPLSYSERAVQTFPSAELIVMKGQNHGFNGADRQRAVEAEADFIWAQEKQ